MINDCCNASHQQPSSTFITLSERGGKSSPSSGSSFPSHFPWGNLRVEREPEELALREREPLSLLCAQREKRVRIDIGGKKFCG